MNGEGNGKERRGEIAVSPKSCAGARGGLRCTHLLFLQGVERFPNIVQTTRTHLRLWTNPWHGSAQPELLNGGTQNETVRKLIGELAFEAEGVFEDDAQGSQPVHEYSVLG